MNKPKIVAKEPIKVELKKGDKKYWCACGLSNNQIFCDGSHKTTDIKPIKFIANESRNTYLCRCKHTKNPPLF